MATACQPKIQFNLTQSANESSSNESSNDAADTSSPDAPLDLTDYAPLSKKTVKEHQGWFFTNGKRLFLDCILEQKA